MNRTKNFLVMLMRILVAAVLMALVTTVANAQTRTFTEWAVPTASAGPLHVASASATIFYFTETSASKIGRLNSTTNMITEWTLPSNSTPHQVAVTTNGIVFCAMGTSYIGLLNPTTSVLTQWHLPNASPGHMRVAGSAIVFTETKDDKIGMLDTLSGQLTEWPIPTPNDIPWGIVQASSTQFFFVESVSNKIAMLDLSANTFTEWAVPSVIKLQHLYYIGGVVYFSDFRSSILGRLSPTNNAIVEWTAPTASARILDLASASGLISFTESAGNNIGVLNPTMQTGVKTIIVPIVTTVAPTTSTVTPNHVTVSHSSTAEMPTITTIVGVVAGGFAEWAVPTASSWPAGMILRSGNVIFAEEDADKIATLQ